MKIKQYNNAVEELVEKNYLVMTKGNNYIFNENPVITKKDNDVMTKKDNDVITKEDNPLLPLETRNNTNTTLHNTNNNTEKNLPAQEEKYQEVSKREMISLGVPFEVIDEEKSLYKILATNKIVKAV